MKKGFGLWYLSLRLEKGMVWTYRVFLWLRCAKAVESCLFPRIPLLGVQPRPRLLSVQAPSPYTSASMPFSPPCPRPLLSSHRHHLPIALVWGEYWPSLTPLIAAFLHLRYDFTFILCTSVVLQPATTPWWCFPLVQPYLCSLVQCTYPLSSM